MATLEDLTVDIGVNDSGLEDQVSRIGDIMETEFALKIADSVGQAGDVLEEFAQQQQGMTADLRQLSAATGIEESAMRGLATETSNVTFPLEDVVDLMETGRQRGLQSAEALQEYATFWDVVGDATGESATALGQAGVALQAVGIEAGNESEAMSALGFVHQETTGSISEFLNFLDRTGPELREMEADVDDAAAILGVMEHELGMSGRTARQEFRTAVGEADGDLDKLLDTLGISEDQFSSMRGQVEQSSDVLDRNAEIVADSFTPLQRVNHQVDELMTQYGGLADAAGMLGPLLMGLVPVMQAVAMAKGSVNLAFLASPVTWIVLGIVAAVAALIAIGVLVWKNWDTILEGIGAAWEWLRNSIIDPFVSFIMDTVWRGGIKKALDAIGGAVQWLAGLWKKQFDAALNVVRGVADFITSIPGKIRSGFSNLVSIITSPFRSAFNKVAGFWNRTVGSISFTAPSWVPGIGGRGFSMPRVPTFHDGGVVPGSGEQLILAQGGEGVLSRRAMRELGQPGGAAGGGTVLRFEADGSHLSSLLVELFREVVRVRGGGDVQVAFGGS